MNHSIGRIWLILVDCEFNCKGLSEKNAIIISIKAIYNKSTVMNKFGDNTFGSAFTVSMVSVMVKSVIDSVCKSIIKSKRKLIQTVGIANQHVADFLQC
ncbi:MAG: hypothetical protein FWH37_10075 [Candidatus Bathyarchaeota archaeon]|nr:hypothetical protein [Candidatus Termiticorpusculum sp.]